MNQKESNAIDLFLEDLNTPSPNIRSRAKEMGCESELNLMRDRVIKYVLDFKYEIIEI